MILQTGIIGNTEKLEPFVKLLRENRNFDVIGKASIGTSAGLDDFHYSMPEINRVELIERAEVLLIDDSLSSPFSLLSDMVKKSKHIFMAGYLNLTTDECAQLVKLANESGSVVQVYNPFYFSPEIRWIGSNVTMPVFLEIMDFTGSGQTNQELYPILLMLLDITGISPKKVAAVTFKSAPNSSDFTNVRLEFGNASVVNLNYGSIGSLKEFKIRSYSQNQFIRLNFTENTFFCNNRKVDFTDFETTGEFNSMANAIFGKTRLQSSLEDYLIAMHLVQKINKKTSQFITE